MDSKQKSIEEMNLYDVDQTFIDSLKRFPNTYRIPVATMVDHNAKELPEHDGKAQKFGGVIKDDNPFFFEVEFLKAKGDIPIFLDVSQISVDQYLDYIIEHKSLKPYGEQDTDSDHKG